LYGMLTIGISIAECMTLGVLLSNYPLGDMSKLIAFLLVGIGYDDTYVLMNGFDRCMTETDDPEELVRNTFATNGVSITVSSLTSFISFSMGNLSSL